jgi:hypothetical protein
MVRFFEYIDPTGHVKETPEQETVEKGHIPCLQKIV